MQIADLHSREDENHIYGQTGGVDTQTSVNGQTVTLDFLIIIWGFLRVSLQADFPSPKNRVSGYEHPKFSTLTTTDGSEKNIFVGQIFRGVEEFFWGFRKFRRERLRY